MSEALVAALNGLSEGILKGLSIREQRLAREQEAELKTKQLTIEEQHKRDQLALDNKRLEHQARKDEQYGEYVKGRLDNIEGRQKLQDERMALDKAKFGHETMKDTDSQLAEYRRQYNTSLLEEGKVATALAKKKGLLAKWSKYGNKEKIASTQAEVDELERQSELHKNQRMGYQESIDRLTGKLAKSTPKQGAPQGQSAGPPIPAPTKRMDEMTFSVVREINSAPDEVSLRKTLKKLTGIKDPETKMVIFDAAEKKLRALQQRTPQGGVVPEAQAAELGTE
jgi:hypothetical protein